MPDYKTIGGLCKALQKKVEKAIQENVPEVVKDEMVRQIDAVVYNAYPNPIEYQRTYALKDKDNIAVANVPDGVSIQNVRSDGDHPNDEGTGKYVAYTVESGLGYDHPYPGMAPRPFTDATREALARSGAHIEATKKGLKSLGVNVE